MNNSKFNERLEHALKISGISAAELSRKSNLGKPAISQYLSGKIVPKQDKIYLLSKALNVSPIWLMGISDTFSGFQEVEESQSVISKNLRQNMISKDISIKELATLCGVDANIVKEWLDGSLEPTLNDIQNICRCLDIYKSELLGINQTTQHKSRGFKIPVVGRVAAGLPLDAIEEIIDYEEISHAMAKTGEYFGLQIKGDSMEPRMLEGDVVIVRKQNTVESGDIAIVLVNGDDATCKKVKILNNGIMLMPLNTKYEPWEYNAEEIESKPVRIIGKVVELRGKF